MVSFTSDFSTITFRERCLRSRIIIFHSVIFPSHSSENYSESHFALGLASVLIKNLRFDELSENTPPNLGEQEAKSILPQIVHS